MTPFLFQSRRRRLLALIAGAYTSSQFFPGHALAGPNTFTDLMPSFWAAYDAYRNGTLEARAMALVTDFFTPHADAYRRAGVGASPAAIARWLGSFDRRADDARAVHQRFARDYDGYVVRFRQALPSFDEAASPVTLLPSLMHFDAHLQPDGPVLPLFFDPDAIAHFHGRDADLGALFSHELFHCFQGQANPAMALDSAPPAFANLWIEGTATYASERMNPGTPLLHVLLDDEALAQIDAASFRAAARALLAAIDARDEPTLALFFESGHHGDGWPARAGYAVGLRIARDAGTTMSLSDMAALPAASVRARVTNALRALIASDAASYL